MKFFIVLCLISLCSCGQEEETFSVGGMNVYAGDHYITRDRVVEVITETENAFNKFFPGLNLMELLNEQNLKVYYYDFGNGSKERGVFFASDNHIEMNYDMDFLNQPEVMCMENYYVLGHELMHYIILYYLGKESQNHDTPYIWVQWQLKDNIDCNTAEFQFYSHMAVSCGYWQR